MKRWYSFIEYMTKVETKQWQSVIHKMAWAYRKHEVEAPAGVAEWVALMPPREEWQKVREEISRRRRAVSNEAFRARTKSRHKSRIERRRAYMKAYMRNYRKRAATKLSGGVQISVDN